MKRILVLCLCGLALAAAAAPKKLSPIISYGHGGLVYDLDVNSNRVPDFSTCGYMGGDRRIPTARVVVVVSPQAGDETMRIQKALNYAGNLPADVNGLRGAVLLLKGRHEIFGQLLITNSGVILRGQGAGEDGTILVAAGNSRRTLIHIDNGLPASANAADSGAKNGREIADNYVPVGATSFHLKDGGGLKPGDVINVIRPSTKEWIDKLGMTEFGGGLGDWRLVWKPGTRDL
ncbi:MAG TPA: pectate lyase, partial [Verrucomicrobiae bacterium]